MRIAIIIPARYQSSRYPGKPLVELQGADGSRKPLVRRAWEAAMRVKGVDTVLVATDDARIADAVHGFGGQVAMTSSVHTNGTERCAEVLETLGDVDIVVNLQGDAPLTPGFYVDAVITALRESPEAMMATPAIRCSSALLGRLLDDQKAGRVGGTTAVFGEGGRALYFSKRVIPYIPEAQRAEPDLPVFFHVGLYAYRPAALRAYAAQPVAAIERLEGLEQLRFLHAGLPVKVVEVAEPGWDIWELNNPSDVPVVEAALARAGIN
jgi:3-deoxy-manno-octulosonate cytidylyltransferase (CMP-KDO synthetase)